VKSWLGRIFPKNEFLRGVGILVGGTASAQVLLVLASPLLTRLYTPADFGLLAVYSALLALFSVVSSLRYELAIPLPESNGEAANILVLSLIVVAAMTGISCLMILLAGDQIASALDSPNLVQYFWLLPIGIFLAGIYKVFNYWAVRTKSFGDITVTRISQTLVTLAFQLFLYKLGSLALLLGQAGGQGIGSYRLTRSALKHEEFRTWSWSGIWAAARRYKQFPIFSTWSGLFNTGGTQLPPLIFATCFSASSAGFYALASRILNIPMSLIGGAIGQVYFSDLAEAKRESKLSKLIQNGILSLLKLSLPAAGCFMLIAPDLFSFVFGAEWQMSGEIARWMVPWILFQFISSPLSTLFFVLEKENLGLYFQASMLLIRVASLMIGFLYYDFFQTLIIFSLASALCYFLYTVNIVMLASIPLKWLFLTIGRELALVLFAAIPVLYFYLTSSLVLAYILAIIITLVFYILRLRTLFK